MSPPRGGRAREDRLLAELGRLRDDGKRRALLSRNRSLKSAAVVARLGEEVIRRFRVDLDEAMALAEAAEMIARDLGEAEPLARALRAKGNALFGRNDHRAAVERLEEAARLFAEAGLETEVGRTFSTSIQPLILLGEYQRAEEAAEKARAIFSREGDALRLARLELNVGNIHHRQDRFAEALACYERGYEQLVPFKNVEGIAVALGNMAMCLITLNDFPRALETHRRARAFCEEHGLPRLVALADYNIAYLYFFRGQYGEAIEALKATRVRCEALGDAYLAALCRLDLSELYLELNLSPDAAAMAEEARDAFAALGNGYEAAKARGFLAIAHGQQGKVLRSLEMFAEAKAGFVRERNAAWPGLMDLYRAMILMAAGRLFEARRSALEALAALGAPALVSKAVLCRLLLSRLALKMGDPDGARDECDRAAEMLAPLDLPALSFQMHYVRGQIARAAGEAAAAYEAYRAALRFLETLRSSLRGEELKIAFLKNKLEVYESLVDLCLARGGPGALEEAFGYVEQAKSRSLQELLLKSAVPAPPHPTGKSDIVRRVGELREELNWYYHRIEAEQLSAEEKAEGRLDELRSAVAEHEGELLRVLRDLPLEAEPLELLAPVSLPLEAVRAALPAGAMIVEYFRVGSRLLAFLVTRETLEVVPVAVVPRVQHVLRLLQFQLGWARPGAAEVSEASRKSLFESTQAHLRELYDELVAPVRARLAARHLVVVPHDLLHYVPFHALHDGAAHLVDAFSFSYAPSATIYALCHGRPRRAQGGSLVLGVPEPHTPKVAEEAKAVAERLPGARLFLGDEATADVVRELAPGSRYVHVAAHGFFRGDNPMFSGIRLGSGSYLTLYDLHALRVPAALVALSACVSGLNVIAAGDEILGLARGLFRAGADSLLLTLWEVPDESTSLFMTDFYERALRTGDLARALQEATVHLRERFPHPIHWAPFVLSGKFSAATDPDHTG